MFLRDHMNIYEPSSSRTSRTGFLVGMYVFQGEEMGQSASGKI